MTSICVEFRNAYLLNFKKVNPTLPFTIIGEWIDGNALLVFNVDGTYEVKNPHDGPPYTCYEYGIYTTRINDTGTQIVEVTPLIIISATSGVSGYSTTYETLPAASVALSNQTYQVGINDALSFYQCDGTTWNSTSNPSGGEIFDLLELPSSCTDSDSKVYHFNAGTDVNIDWRFYGCVNNVYAEITNQQDPFCSARPAILGVTIITEFSINSGTFVAPRKEITSFVFEASLNANLDDDIVGIIENKTNGNSKVNIQLPYNTNNIENLIPTIVITGSSISPISGVVNNFSTTNYSNYEVIAVDDSTRMYDVNLSNLSDTYANLISFKFEAIHNSVLSVDVHSVIDNVAGTVTVVLPYGVVSTNLIPTFIYRGNTIQISTVDQVSGVTANNYSSDDGVTYVITPTNTNATTRNFIVTVTNTATENDKRILSFDFIKNATENTLLASDIIGVIDETAKTILLEVGDRVNFSNLSPTITFAGTSINPVSNTVVSFTRSGVGELDSAIFTVTAYDTTTQEYVVSLETTEFEQLLGVIVPSPQENADVNEPSDDEGVGGIILPEGVAGAVSTESKLPICNNTSLGVVYQVGTGNSKTYKRCTSTGWQDGSLALVGQIIKWEDKDDSVLFPLNIAFGEEFTGVIKAAAGNIKAFNGFLGNVKSAGNLAKILLNGFGNPVYLALEFVLDQLLEFIRGIKNSGVYSCIMIADPLVALKVWVQLTELKPGQTSIKGRQTYAALSPDEGVDYNAFINNTRAVGDYISKFSPIDYETVKVISQEEANRLNNIEQEKANLDKSSGYVPKVYEVGTVYDRITIPQPGFNVFGSAFDAIGTIYSAASDSAESNSAKFLTMSDDEKTTYLKQKKADKVVYDTKKRSAESIINKTHLANTSNIDGFFMLPAKDALNMLADSFTDPNDPNGPLYVKPVKIESSGIEKKPQYRTAPDLLDPEKVVAGGIVLWFGVSDGMNWIKVYKMFIEIIDNLAEVFNESKFDKFKKELSQVYSKLGEPWEWDTEYSVGDVVTPGARSEEEATGSSLNLEVENVHRYICVATTNKGSNKGMSHETSEPNWVEDIGERTVDNELIWENITSVDFPVGKKNYPYWNPYQATLGVLHPTIGDTLDLVELWLLGMKEKITTGNEVLESLIDYLDKKIQQLELISSKITKLVELLLKFPEYLSQIDFEALYVQVQTGGINKIKEGLTMTPTDENFKPKDDAVTCAVLTYVGVGDAIAGFVILAKLLGMDDSSFTDISKFVQVPTMKRDEIIEQFYNKDTETLQDLFESEKLKQDEGGGDGAVIRL